MTGYTEVPVVQNITNYNTTNILLSNLKVLNIERTIDWR